MGKAKATKPKAKKADEAVEAVKEVEVVETPAVEKVAELFITADAELTDKLIGLGFHVADQKVVDGKLTYTFKEPKEEIADAI